MLQFTIYKQCIQIDVQMQNLIAREMNNARISLPFEAVCSFVDIFVESMHHDYMYSDCLWQMRCYYFSGN